MEDPNVIWVSPPDIQRALDLDPEQVQLALKNLIRGGLINARTLASGDIQAVTDVTERALREVGRWPTPESALDRMIAALEEIVENTDDDDKRTRARKVLDAFRNGSRDFAIQVAAAAVAGGVVG